MEKDAEFKKYIALSKEITGYGDLSNEIAESHWKSLLAIADMDPAAERVFCVGDLKNLIDQYTVGQVAELYDHEEFLPILKEILFLWYLGFPSSSKLAPYRDPHSASYYESLLWRSIRAHPPGIPGGYFGHWHYLPED